MSRPEMLAALLRLKNGLDALLVLVHNGVFTVHQGEQALGIV